MRHVAGCVDVNEKTDAGDDQHHDDGELIHLQVKTRGESARRNPVEEMFAKENLPAGEKFTDCFEREEKRKASRAKRNAVDDLVWPLAAQQAVNGRAKQRQQRNNPQMIEYGH